MFQPRISTLSILSRFLGYTCWDDYLANLMRSDITESDYITAKLIRTHDLCEGDLLHIAWHPDRDIKIRYIGNFHFKVVSSENSKLNVGDTFMAMSFSIGNPLIITDLAQGDNSSLEYIAGKKNGLTTLEIISG